MHEAEAAPDLSRRLAGVFETLWVRRAASRPASLGAAPGWTPSEALAPVRGAVLGALLGGACWVLVVALARALAG